MVKQKYEVKKLKLSFFVPTFNILYHGYLWTNIDV